MADLTVVGDSSSSVIELGLASRRHGVRLIAPLRLDARLFTPAPTRVPRRVRRPRVAADRLPNRDVVLADPRTVWSLVAVRWSDGADRDVEVASGTAVWEHNGFEPLPIRWVLIRDPAGRLEPRAYLATKPDDEAVTIPAEMVKRWPIEECFELARGECGLAHGEGRTWHSWLRHITLSIVRAGRSGGIAVAGQREWAAEPPAAVEKKVGPELIPLTVPEVRRLLTRLVLGWSHSFEETLAFSVPQRCGLGKKYLARHSEIVTEGFPGGDPR